MFDADNYKTKIKLRISQKINLTQLENVAVLCGAPLNNEQASFPAQVSLACVGGGFAWQRGASGGPPWLTWLYAVPASPLECLWPAPDRKAMGSDHLASPPFQSSGLIMEQQAR